MASAEKRWEDEWTAGVQALCARCRRETGFHPVALVETMDERGGLETVRQVLAPQALEYGFERICELGRPDLTVEAWVLTRSDCGERFTVAELARAKERVAAGHALNWRRRISER